VRRIQAFRQTVSFWAAPLRPARAFRGADFQNPREQTNLFNVHLLYAVNSAARDKRGSFS